MPVKGDSIIFLKPEVYMNNTGKCVQSAVSFFKIPVEHIIVLHDDIELPFGTVTLKKGGGSAGHNGLRSITQHLGSNAYYRMRLGIGRPRKAAVASYVLGRFSPEEEPLLPDFITRVINSLEAIINGTPETPFLPF